MSEFDDLFTPDPQSSNSQFRIGKVNSLSNGNPLVQFDGETSASQKIYKRLASYSSPLVNDRVLLLQISGSYIILGKII